MFRTFTIALGLTLAATSPLMASQSDKRCLAEVIYHEARGESETGQMAVAEVVMNRTESPHFPKTVCGVVNQRGQFAPKKRISEQGAYRDAVRIANAVYEGKAPEVTQGATYFHTPAVRPSWSRRFTRTKQIGSHIFYRR